MIRILFLSFVLSSCVTSSLPVVSELSHLSNEPHALVLVHAHLASCTFCRECVREYEREAEPHFKSGLFHTLEIPVGTLALATLHFVAIAPPHFTPLGPFIRTARR